MCYSFVDISLFNKLTILRYCNIVSGFMMEKIDESDYNSSKNFVENLLWRYLYSIHKQEQSCYCKLAVMVHNLQHY